MLVSKEFYVDEYDLENMSCFTVSRHPVPMRGRTLKITISYEIDREVTIKESELKGVLNKYLISELTVDNIMTAVFGGGENE